MTTTTTDNYKRLTHDDVACVPFHKNMAPELAADLLRRHVESCGLCKGTVEPQDPDAYVGASNCAIGDTLEGLMDDAIQRAHGVGRGPLRDELVKTYRGRVGRA
jgi:hypothetical protein